MAFAEVDNTAFLEKVAAFDKLVEDLKSHLLLDKNAVVQRQQAATTQSARYECLSLREAIFEERQVLEALHQMHKKRTADELLRRGIALLEQ